MPHYVSLGIIAWNEAETIGATLDSVFRQSLFGELNRRGLRSELICVANGCTDDTGATVARVFAQQAREHPEAGAFSCRVVNLAERGKLNAWNQFVHRFSAPEARLLFLVDADILIHRRETLWNMLLALENAPEAQISVDRPCKDLAFKAHQSQREKLSLAAARVTLSAPAQLCAQLYCIRAEIARRIYLPKDLGACEDGFIKALVCTDFLEHEVRPERIRLAADAEHTFEAYTSLGALVRNQKRQILGQTVVHVLVDNFFKTLSPSERTNLAETLRAKDNADPAWLKRLIAGHLRRTRFFWQLYPGLLGHRFTRLARLGPAQRLKCLPATVAASAIALLSSFLAYRALKSGCTDYWPQAQRLALGVHPLGCQNPLDNAATAFDDGPQTLLQRAASRR